MKLGSGQLTFEEAEGWARLPEGWDLGEVPGIAVDSRDRVYAFCRAENPVVIFDRDGSYLDSWGKGLFVRPHMIFIGPDDSVYCVDDNGHRVHKFTTEGELLMTLAPTDGVADTGYNGTDVQSILRSGPPFNTPTDVALAPDGNLFVSDGYGNARVHKFSPDGQLLLSWGDPGDGPSQFRQPHGVYVDPEGKVYVADRQNCRIQIFSPEGEFLDQWTEVWWPNDLCQDRQQNFCVAEIGGIFMYGREARLDKPAARMTVRAADGSILAEWCEQDPYGTGRFFSPHSVAVDSHGDVYVGQVTFSYTKRQAPPGSKVLRKYVRQ